ncbi:2-hydroxyacyl-CoA dehydratase subunit D [Chloroflexota bacterium]
MERFQKLLEDPHKYAKEWREKTGGKVMGYFCHYFPEEVAYAAGVLPVRILGRRDADGISQDYLYGSLCPSCHGLLAQGLKGEYDYLDGIGHAECCMTVRAAYASWRLHVPTKYEYFVSVPVALDNPYVGKYFNTEISVFRKAMEEWTGKPITNEAFDHAIEVYNTSRSLMKQVYEMRQADNPVISGAEAFEMILSSQMMDKAEHNKLLEDAIDKLSQRKERGDPGVRLMLLGSEISDTELVRMIESLGATIVIDGLCNGACYIWNNVIPQEDRILAITRRYMERLRCPVKDTTVRKRIDQLMDLAEPYNIQGVIYAIQKFCDPHQFDRPPIEKALQKRNIPIHNFEYDGSVPAGEFKTRIEAFVDMLKPVTV